MLDMISLVSSMTAVAVSLIGVVMSLVLSKIKGKRKTTVRVKTKDGEIVIKGNSKQEIIDFLENIESKQKIEE